MRSLDGARQVLFLVAGVCVAACSGAPSSSTAGGGQDAGAPPSGKPDATRTVDAPTAPRADGGEPAKPDTGTGKETGSTTEAAVGHDAPVSHHEASTDAGDAAHPPAPIYWGALIDGTLYDAGNPPWDMSSATIFEQHAGKDIAIMHWGQTWYDTNNAYQPFYPNTQDLIRTAGYIPMISWFSESEALGANVTSQPTFTLSAIIGGTFDTPYLKPWAEAAATWGYPFFLRFDHEMNGNWYPWSEQVNGNSAGQYVEAWKHVHDIFTAAGATNVSWVWCVNIEGAGLTPLTELYPGDGYVDWIGIDGYNWGSDQGAAWIDFPTLMGQTYTDVQALAPSKPVMIVETSSAESPGSKAAWITQLFQVLPTQFPRVRAFNWFNGNYDEWPIESSASAEAAFAQGIASSYYLPQNPAYSSLPKLAPVPVP
jgi:mannan endo-1,4-beta-mannosidase